MLNTNNPINQEVAPQLEESNFQNQQTNPLPITNNNQPPTPDQTKGSPMLNSTTLYQKFWMATTSIIMLVLALTYFPRLMLRPAQITAIGIGEVDFQPDEVSMIVTNVTTAVNSTETITKGEADTQALIFAAKTIAPDAEISKSFYQTAPATVATGQRIYQTANAFSIKFSNVSKASSMVQSLYADGATSVSNVTFSSTNKDVIEQEAREKAVADAKENAKEIAKASGKRLGRMMAISDDYKSASSTISSEGSNSDFSNVSISKSVSIIYEVW